MELKLNEIDAIDAIDAIEVCNVFFCGKKTSF